jgi:hypothetical protein
MPQVGLRFKRLVDHLTYDFTLEAAPVHGHPSYRRVDLGVWCRWIPGFGWSVVGADGTVTSRPFDDPGLGELPPTGTWVSRKGDRSYVYELELTTP